MNFKINYIIITILNLFGGYQVKTVLNTLGLFVKETNKTLLFMCIALSSFGILMIHSATLYGLGDGQLFSRSVKATVIATAAGIIVCLAVSAFEIDFVTRMWPLIGFGCLALMLSLFVIGRSPSERDDAISWIKLGSFYFQPSELLKAGFTVTFAVHLNNVRDELNKLRNIFYLGLHAMLAIGLVIATGDLGSALVFMFMTVGLMFIAGVYLRYFAIAAVGIGIAAPVIWFEFLSNFQKQRFLAVYHPSSLTESVYKNAIYQQQQGLSAIGAGRITGQGLFNGTYTQGHLVPENQNDMIFSVVGEELGFIGCVALLIFILLIVLKIISIGRKARNMTGRLICYGTAIMIAAQTIINIGMCLEVLPVIGITLPFMSSGGSASLCIYISIGLVLCVYRSSFSHTPTEVRSASISTPFEEI